MAVTPSTRFTFECTIGSRGQRSLRCNKRAVGSTKCRTRASKLHAIITNRPQAWLAVTDPTNL